MADDKLHAKVPMSVITKRVMMQVDVTGVRSSRLRLRVAGWLMRLAARVAGVGIQIKS